MPCVTATYQVYHTFHVPSDVFILDNEANKTAANGTKGKWWVKWNILYICGDKDDDDAVLEIHPDTDSAEDLKYPSNQELGPCEEDEEDEENEEDEEDED